MTVITYRELQRISASKLRALVKDNIVMVTVEGEETFALTLPMVDRAIYLSSLDPKAIQVVNMRGIRDVNRTSQEGLPTGVHEEAKV